MRFQWQNCLEYGTFNLWFGPWGKAAVSLRSVLGNFNKYVTFILFVLRWLCPTLQCSNLGALFVCYVCCVAFSTSAVCWVMMFCLNTSRKFLSLSVMYLDSCPLSWASLYLCFELHWVFELNKPCKCCSERSGPCAPCLCQHSLTGKPLL